MPRLSLIGFSMLLVLWVWLSYLLLAHGGVSLKNLLILAMSGIIVFVPLCKRWFNNHK